MFRNMVAHNCSYIVMALLVLLLGGCEAFFNEYGTGTTDRSIQIVDYPRLRGLLAGASDEVVLVDVRPNDDAFNAEHIPGAIHIPLPYLRANDRRFDDASTVIVYSTGADDLSAVAAKKLIRQSNRTVLDYRGGLAWWKKSGGKTTKAASTPKE